ncbi:dihydroneopterin triphosphate diphosphatase, partial [Pseudoduganella sp. RAF53_2]
FSVEVPREVPIMLSPREHVAHVWLSWLEAADKCFSPSNAEAVLQLPHQLAKYKA